MRILYTTPFVPYPPTYGGTITPYHHLTGLAERGHEIVAVLPLRRPNDEEGISVLGAIGTMRPVRVSEKPAHVFGLEALASVSSLRVARHRFPAVQKEISHVFREEKPFDLVYFDTLFTTYLLPLIRRVAPRTPAVVLEHNVESQVVRRMKNQRRELALQIAAAWDIPLLARIERRAHQDLERVMTFSEEDAMTIREDAPAARVVTLGPGIATYAGETIPPPRGQNVLFLGSYQWPPNIDAAEWMSKEIWPRVRDRVAGARLILAGNDPAGRIAPLADERAGIVVAGFVEDATQTTRAAAVCVAPLRIGGGVRLKIIEALANERPVVTTTIGAEGLGLTPGVHARFADDAESFAASVADLLTGEEEASRSARLGRQYVESRFAWPRVIERLEEILEETVRMGRR